MNKNKKTKKQKKQGIKGGMFGFKKSMRTQAAVAKSPAAVDNSLAAVAKSPAAVSNSPAAVDNSPAPVSKDNVIISISGISVQITGNEKPIIFNVGDMIKCRFKQDKTNDTKYFIIIKFNNYHRSTPIHMGCLPWITRNNKIKDGGVPDSLPMYLAQKQLLDGTAYSSTDDLRVYFSEIEGNNSLRVIDFKTLEFIDNSEYANLESYKSAMGYSVLPKSINTSVGELKQGELNQGELKQGALNLALSTETK